MNPSPASTPGSRIVPANALRPRLPLILALMLATGAEAFTSSAVGIALPRIAASFAASPDEISWVVTLYLAAFAVSLPLTAWRSDVLGQRRYLGLSMLLYAVASLGCLFSASLPELLAFRIVEGAAGAAFLARAIVTFTREFRPPALYYAFFIFMCAFGLRSLGLPFGGYLVDHLSWRWLFAVPVVLLLGGALPALLLSPEIWPRRRTFRPDFAGLALLAAGLGALTIAVVRGERDAWFASPTIVCLLGLAALSLPLFAWQEHRPENRRRMITFASLHHPGMVVGLALSFLAGLMMVGGLYVLPLFLIGVVRCDAFRAGMVMSVDSWSMLAGLALAVWSLGRIRTRALLVAAGALFGGSMLLLAFRITSGTPVSEFYLPMVLHGLGVGLSLPPIGIYSFLSMGANDLHNSEGRAWNFTVRQIGGAVAVGLVVVLLDFRATVHSTQLSAHLATIGSLLSPTLQAIGRGLVAHGLAPALAGRAADAVLGRLVARESTVLAFRDIFLLTAVVGAAMAGLGLCLPRPQPVRAGGRPHRSSVR